MDSPITISSASSTANKVDYVQLQSRVRQSAEKHRLLRDDSSGSERVLPSWDRRSKRHIRTDSNTTLSNIQKVADWIKSMEDNSRLYEGNAMCSPNLDQMKKQECESNKNLILMRCDFNKSVTPPQTCYSPLNQFNCPAPIIKYFQKEKDVEDVNPSLQFQTLLEVQESKKRSPSSIFTKRSENESHLNNKSDFISKISMDKSSVCSSSKMMNDEKSEESMEVYDVPLSAEKRKRELCSYLKLMDPADKKQILILQNRRSTRVRNLAAMQERRQLDKEMKELENKIEKTSEEKCPTMKSFKEINVKFQKLPIVDQDEPLEKGDNENERFYFPFPPKHLLDIVDDFDIVMKKIVPRFKRICNKKQIKFYSHNRIKNKISPKNKENKFDKSKSTKSNQDKHFFKLRSPKTNKNNNNIAGTHSAKLKNRNRSDRLKTLRSNGRIRNISRILENTILKSGKRRKDIDVKQLTKIKRKEELLKKKEKEDGVNRQRNFNKNEPEADKSGENVISETKIHDVAVLSTPKDYSSGFETPIHHENGLNNFHCEILTINSNSEDLKNFMDDISDFNNLSEEHKRCLIESRGFTTKHHVKDLSEKATIEVEINEILTNVSEHSNEDTKSRSPSPLHGFTLLDIENTNIQHRAYQSLLISYVQRNAESSDKSSASSKDNLSDDKADIMDQPCSTTDVEELGKSRETEDISPHYNGETVSDESNLEEDQLDSSESPMSDDYSEIDVVTVEEKLSPKSKYTKQIYAAKETPSNVKDTLTSHNHLELSPKSLPKKSDYEILPFNKSVEIKSLQKSLQFVKKKNNSVSIDSNLNQEWDSDESPKPKVQKQSHFISINKENGDVLKVFYVDYNLFVCQEFVVSLWTQTPLGKENFVSKLIKYFVLH